MTHIQQRRDTAAVWALVNPILMDGEMGHESDTGKSKMGDGVTEWNALPYRLGVHSVAGKTGDVNLSIGDVSGAAPLDSPALIGTPTAPTRNPSASDESVATTEFVQMAVMDAIAAMKNALYPPGAIYFTTSDATEASPGYIFGGVWERWGGGRVPVGVDPLSLEFHSAEMEGGVSEVTLTADQSGLPSHAHPISDPKHSHNVSVGYAGFGSPNNTVNADPATNTAPVNTTAESTTAEMATGIIVEAASEQNAEQPHTNMQPYVTCYMWKRVS